MKKENDDVDKGMLLQENNQHGVIIVTHSTMSWFWLYQSSDQGFVNLWRIMVPLQGVREAAVKMSMSN